MLLLMQNSPALGTAIRTLRTSAGITLADLAALAGVSQTYVSRVENGRVAPTDKWIALVVTAIGEHIAHTKDTANAA